MHPTDPADRLARLMRAVRDGGVPYSRIRRLARTSPPSNVVEVAAPILQFPKSGSQYERAARTLAWTDDEAAFDLLWANVRGQKRYPRLAVRALAMSELPAVEDVLVELMDHGSHDQRLAAVYALARRRSALAIGPLCQEMQASERRRKRASEVLRHFGGAARLADLVLEDHRIGAIECAHVLDSFPLNLRSSLFRARYEPEVHLEHALRTAADGDLGRIREVLDLIRARKTLGRAAPPVPNDILLRAAHGGDTPEDRLLRASDDASDECDAPAPSPLSWLLSAFRFFRRA